MFHVMLDTSVWLDLAENQKLTPLLDPLENLLKVGLMNVLVPQQVLDEFTKNRQRVAERAQKSLTSHFNVVREAIRKVDGTGPQKN
jgi:predicted nucleic acid-binding protein